MPKSIFISHARMAQEEKRMCAVVAGSSRPERTLKNEVFRLSETMNPRDMGSVLGKVYMRLGAHERTASMAEYMKDLYGSGTRRLFSPRPITGIKQKVKPVGIRQIVVEGMKLVLTDGPVEDTPLVNVGRFVASTAGKSGGRVRFDKALERARAMAAAAKSSKVAASADAGTPTPSGADPDKVVSLESVANYCLHTASVYGEVKPVYDMLMELFSNHPNKEWIKLKEKIKAHMDTLPKGPYIIVSGDHVEHKQITNNVEKVEADGMGIVQKTVSAAPKKDGRKRPVSTGKKVNAVYKYNHFKEKDAYLRLDWLYRALIQNEWIDKDTEHDLFMDLFSGEPKEFTIKWLAAQSDLYALIKNLFKMGLISATRGGGKWKIAENHFVDRNSRVYIDMNRQRENLRSKSLIRLFVSLLNPAIPITEELLKDLKLLPRD